MDMRQYAGESFIKVADVGGGPIQEQIAVIKTGKWDKPNLVFESGSVLSLNATNTKILVRAYGSDSDGWVNKRVELYLGEIEFQGSPREAVLVRPISPPDDHEASEAAAAKPKPEKPKTDFDDSIPF